ncbi:MAG: glycosyltransferase family 1 protein [Candidatus Schekmanbacteria bacterium]|nr:MAG: glycosyltransferase family 1 protein [Candidatus Schekmanbacteria bacterium]
MKEKEEAKKLRILHINAEKEYRGGEMQTLLLSKKLIERGHQNIICCQPESGIEKECNKAKVPFFTVKMKSDADIIAAFKIMRWISNNTIDIIHTHNPRALAMGFFIKLLNFGIPHIYTRRIDFPLKSGVLSMMKYNRGADKIIALSNSVKDSLLKGGVDENKIVLIRGGIEKERFQKKNLSYSIKEEFSLPNDAFILGTVSHLSKHKGHSLLLEAVEKIAQKGKNVFLIIVGEGPLKKELKLECRKRNIEERVKFAGFRKDVENLISRFYILIHPTIEGEGSPSAIKEAMICGIPVIASDIPPIREIIRDKVEGILVKAGKSEEIEKGILSLIDNPTLRQKLSQAALKKAEKEFDLDEAVLRTEHLYYEVLKNYESYK